MNTTHLTFSRLILTGLLVSSCTQVTVSEPVTEPVKLDKQLEQKVHSDGTKASLQLLAESMERDADVSAFCHGLAHKIGHAAYKEHGLDALEDADDICGSGYFHGVIEKHFENTADVLSTFKDICDTTNGRCFHGLGHGLMFANNNNLPESVALCNELDTRFQRVQCAEGVFMENFNSNQEIHQTEYKDPNNPFYPCNIQEQPYKAVCAFYAVRYYLDLHPNDYAGVVNWCNTVDQDSIDACVKGIGSAITKLNIQNIQIASNTCNLLTDENKEQCYDGIVSYIIVHNASAQSGAKWCKELTGVLQKRCLMIVQDSATYYGE
jgi:hypothetical protein